MFKHYEPFSSFSVDDLNEAKAFYMDKLGLQLTHDNDMMLTLNFSESNHVIVYAKPNHKPASHTVLNFPVPDIIAAVDELAAKGIQFEHYNTPDLKTDEKGICRGNGGPDIAWFKDPAGNTFSVLENK
jgi:catechol 2,3-dioxygenase-like lactoylglutathione lyase family enzyme